MVFVSSVICGWFCRWLQGCHKHFDQEIRLTQRDQHLENLLRVRGTSTTVGATSSENATEIYALLGADPAVNRQVSIFKELVVSNNGICKTIKSGDIVKVSRENQKRLGKLNRTKDVLAQIISFEVRKVLPEHQVCMRKIRSCFVSSCALRHVHCRWSIRGVV